MSDTPSANEAENPEAVEQLAAQAEDVRAYLVGLRGGAPFLSGADSALLYGWLTEGVPVAVILASMDRVAHRRRQRRIRGKLSLNACAGEIRHMMGHRPQGRAATRGGLAQLAAEIAQLDLPRGLRAARVRLVQELRRLDAAGPKDIEERARQAIAACRRFHEAAWAALAAERPALLKDAADELSSLRDILRGPAWDTAVEEVARDTMRSRFPLISAEVVWDWLNTH